MIKKNSFQKKEFKPVDRNCPFCKKELTIDLLETDVLKKYVTERGKIIGKDRSGVCSKHQRDLGNEIKRARFLGLLPYFSSKVK